MITVLSFEVEKALLRYNGIHELEWDERGFLQKKKESSGNNGWHDDDDGGGIVTYSSSLHDVDVVIFLTLFSLYRFSFALLRRIPLVNLHLPFSSLFLFLACFKIHFFYMIRCLSGLAFRWHSYTLRYPTIIILPGRFGFPLSPSCWFFSIPAFHCIPFISIPPPWNIERLGGIHASSRSDPRGRSLCFRFHG